MLNNVNEDYLIYHGNGCKKVSSFNKMYILTRICRKVLGCGGGDRIAASNQS